MGEHVGLEVAAVHLFGLDLVAGAGAGEALLLESVMREYVRLLLEEGTGGVGYVGSGGRFLLHAEHLLRTTVMCCYDIITSL